MRMVSEQNKLTAMSQKTTPHEILSRFKPVAEERLSERVSGWLRFHEQNLSAFQNRFRQTLARLEKLSRQDDLLHALWSELGDFYHALQEWTGRLTYLSEESALDDVLQGEKARFAAFWEPFPKDIKIGLSESYWEPQPGDSLHVKLWKYQRRARNRFIRAGYALRNGFRKLFRRQALPVPQIYQTFSPAVFSECYLSVPFDRFLLGEWEKYLHLASRQIDALHRVVRQLHSQLIFLEEVGQVWIQADVPKIAARLESLREFSSAVEALFDEITAFRPAMLERFEQWFAETEKNFHDQWHFAGTHILREKRIASLSGNARKRVQNQFERDKKAWIQDFSVEREDWINEIALRNIQLNVCKEYLQAVQQFQAKISGQIIPVFSTAIAAIRTSTDKFKSLEQKRADLKRAIISENRALQKSLRDEILPEMMDALLEARLDQALNPLLETTRQLGKTLPDKQTVFRKKDLDHLPPDSKVDDVPIGELFNEKLLLAFDRQIEEYRQELRQAVENIIRDISEVDQVVEFNLDAALNLLEKRKETGEAFQTVMEGLERAAGLVEQFINRGTQFRQQSETELFRIVREFIQDVQELLDNEALLKLKIQLAHTKAKERIHFYRQKIWNFFKLIIPRIWSYLKQAAGLVRSKYSQLRKITGLAPAALDSQAALFQFLSETRRKITSLPYVYQRLFENRPLTDERFFAGREDELSELNEDFKTWQQGYFVTTAITGERGSGKTTVINFAKEWIFAGQPVREIDVKTTIWRAEDFIPHLQSAFPECRASTLPEMQKALLQLQEPVVCIVENTQNLFLKTVDGFDLLEEFLLLISRTHRQVYWVLTCTLYSWAYLDKVINISRFFRRVLSLDNLTRHEMENVILRRHRVTGYRLFFETPEKIQKNRRFKKLTGEEAQQAYIQDLFFKELQEVASGNVSVAILYWIRAIRKIENSRLTLWPLIEQDYSFMYQLSAEELFTIGALIQHEMLKPEEHAQVFHQSEQQSVMLFNSLINKGIITENENGCRIHPFLYRPALVALKRLNIIH